MELFWSWPALSIGISVISAGVLTYYNIRNGKDKLSAETLKQYADALEVREITIKDLNKKLEEKDKLHAEQMTAMQAQITGLQSQITALTSKNQVLEDAVTGKVYLEKILEILTAFQPLLSKDGILQEFQNDHAKSQATLNDIKHLLDINKRQRDGRTEKAN